MGAAGAMARVSVRDLLASEGVERIGLADLKLDRVREVSDKLGDDRLEAIQADANDAGSMKQALTGYDAVINSTWYALNLKVMGSAIKGGLHYLDLGGLYHMTLKQLDMDRQARDAGVSCILGLGSAPGVTNLMAAFGASRLSKILAVKIRVGGGAAKPSPGLFNPPYSFRTILDEACLPAAVLRGGRIEMVPGLSVKEGFELPDPVSRVEGYITLHSELATLPKSLGKGIQDMDFIVAFSPEFTRALHLLVNLGLAAKDEVRLPGGKVVPYELLTRLVDILPRPEGTPFDFGVRRVELIGEASGHSAHLIYDCISGPHDKWGIGGRALGTGVPASLGAQWLARGWVKQKGVFPPESVIDPKAFLHELAENGRGILTYEDEGTGRHQL
ncbi:MAG: saccharopine dehydrogenase NADP-binding domain-containing protein [Thaumarchaeota archaeon]|nr:saccharopine dehydrogenase NADP-binding domain-containing protein [Nitrososphaerota archaeon]